MNIKKNDNVIVLTGKDKGKTGKVLKAFPKEDKVLIEGVNIKKIHERARKQGQKGQIVSRATPIHVSNVRLEGDKK
jgi:large subunit ribosomal protein L24